MISSQAEAPVWCLVLAACQPAGALRWGRSLEISSLSRLFLVTAQLFLWSKLNSYIADTYGTLPWVPNTMDTFETEEQEVQRPWGQEG